MFKRLPLAPDARMLRGTAESITPREHPMDGQIVACLRECLPDVTAIYRYGSAGGIWAQFST